MSSVLSTLLVSASGLLLIALGLDLSSNSVVHRAANSLLVLAVFVSLGVSLMWRPHIESSVVSRPMRWTAGCLAIGTSFAVGLAHHHPGSLYLPLVSLLVGVSVATVAADVSSLSEPKSHGSWTWLFFLAVLALGVVGREVAPGSFVQTWIVSPLFVLVMPGLALAYGFLPPRTAFMERLFWAPVLSIAVQLLSLIWLDWLSIEATLPVFYLTAIGFTVAGLVASEWDRGARAAR